MSLSDDGTSPIPPAATRGPRLNAAANSDPLLSLLYQIPEDLNQSDDLGLPTIVVVGDTSVRKLKVQSAM